MLRDIKASEFVAANYIYEHGLSGTSAKRLVTNKPL